MENRFDENDLRLLPTIAANVRVSLQNAEAYQKLSLALDELRGKILQPFFTTKKGTAGTGLGLSITNDIVKAHGGSHRVDSSNGEGTAFTIALPVYG